MSILNEAAFIKAPIEGRVIQLNISTTAARFEVPASWAGQYVTAELFADAPGGAAIAADIVFGDSAVACTYDQDSSVTTQVITISDASGMRLVSGQAAKVFVMPTIGSGTGQATHFSVDASGDGKLQMIRG